MALPQNSKELSAALTALKGTAWSLMMMSAMLNIIYLTGSFFMLEIYDRVIPSRNLATLFGLTLLSHQIGGFLGAYLGGLAVAHFGDYQWMWYADMALSAAAGLVNLPIQEAPIKPVPVPA